MSVSALGLPVPPPPAHIPAPPPPEAVAAAAAGGGLAEGHALLNGLMKEKTSLGPVPWRPMLEHIACDGDNGYVQREDDGTTFVGIIGDGVPEGAGAVRWRDGAEYHGDFSRGVIHGQGVYLFGDGCSYAGSFVRGMPQSGFFTEANGVLHRVEYRGDAALWAGAAPMEKEELPTPIIPAGRLDVCAALVDASEAGPTDMALVTPQMYAHIRDVTAPLVFARPQHAELPLWNADEVRGKIVAVMRGPPPPSAGTSYARQVLLARRNPRRRPCCSVWLLRCATAALCGCCCCCCCRV